jgi:hypothetical protein
MMHIDHQTQSFQKACQKMIPCHEAMGAYTEKIQPSPRMMEPVGEHQSVPSEEATVMPVGGLRKQCRDWNLAAERHHKLKGRIQVSCGSQKRLTVASRKMTCHVRVTLRRTNVIRIYWTRRQVD